MELGIMTNVYRWERLNSKNSPYIKQMRDCAAAGFRVLDLNTCFSVHAGQNDDLAADDWEARIEAVGEEAARLGVRFSQMHAPFNGDIFVCGKQPTAEYVENFRKMSLRAVRAAGKLGIPWVVVHPLTDTVNTEYDNEIQKRTNIEFYAEMLDAARRVGTGLAFENMAEFNRETCRRRYGAATEDLIDLVDTLGEGVGVCWDFGHGRELYADQPRQLRKLGARLKATHVHDNRGERDSHLIPFVGGNIKWETIMPTLREIGYEGDFILETHMFMKQIPEALRPSAGRLMYEFGMYCMKLYENQ
ncbi:MAG: sugar phosphate isomerase/epimerase [Clostridia bacterium]|nr:sugar phosphate isomerase/epimerase [Clostridia bacterium]